MKKNDALAAVLSTEGLDAVLKPLTREIHLFDTFVAGTTHLENAAPLAKVQVNDRLLLQRQADRFNEQTVLVLTESRELLGRIPERDNAIFARLMDAGKLLGARVTSLERRAGVPLIGIAIHLVDF